ncbi:uncharacterized protein [Ptychodera flava]|uniref:uncharacterized protein n=1 Tax=Ptychodera flava TaxID=63121 RepID=UPI003969D018
MTVLSLLLGLLLYGSGASVAVSDHMKCQKFIEGGYHSLSLSEMTPIGTELYKVPAFNERTSASHYFFIDACVNKNDRFNVNSKGVLYLAGSLDHDIDQHYQVTVFSYDDSAIGINQCVRYTVDVTVEDVSGWPPYFNESCCFCPTVKNRPKNYPFFIEILLGEAQVPLEEMTSVLWTDRLYMDTSSSGCEIDLYFMLDGVTGTLSKGNFRSEPVIVKCSNKVTNEEFTAGDIEYFESIRKVPVRLQKEGWFAERQDYHFHKFNIGDRFIQEIFAEAFLACRFVFPGLLDIFSITGTFKILGCPDGYYGVQCEKQCICKNGATCHTLHGSCKCAPGWNGPSCDRHDREVCLGAPYREVFYGDHVTISARMYNVSLENRTVTCT